MSVSIDRFVRVLSGGMVVSNDLVVKRYDKVREAIDLIRAQLARLTQAGLQPNPAFVTALQKLETRFALAMALPTNQAKSEAIEPLKDVARTVADRAIREADELVAAADAMRQKADEALAAANQADQAIQQITDPAFRTPLATRLAGMQNVRVNAAAATRSKDIEAARTILTNCVNDANTIAAEAAQAVQLLADRVAKLAPVDQALAALPNTAEIVDAALKNIADRQSAVLRARRNVLATAGPNLIAAELAGADKLAADVAAFGITADQYVEWGKSKVERTMIAGGCQAYTAEAGTDPTRAWLAKGAADVSAALQNLVKKCPRDPKGAIDEYGGVAGEFNRLKARFGTDILEPRLTLQVNQLIANNPDGPEAKMRQALPGPVFNKRLVDVHNAALCFGTNISGVSPGELVAIHTYWSFEFGWACFASGHRVIAAFAAPEGRWM